LLAHRLTSLLLPGVVAVVVTAAAVLVRVVTENLLLKH
jgi:hypothetical protein